MGKAAAARAGQKDLGTEVLALVLLAVTAFLFLSIYSEHLNVSRGASLRNFCGAAGEAIGGLSLTYLGVANSYLTVAILAVWSLCTFFRYALRRWRLRLLGAALLFPGFSILEALVRTPSLDGGLRYRGGVWGEFLLDRVMSRAFDSVGTYLVVGLLLLVGFLLVTDFLVSPLVRVLMRRGGAGAAALGQRIPGLIEKLRAKGAKIRRRSSRTPTSPARKTPNKADRNLDAKSKGEKGEEEELAEVEEPGEWEDIEGEEGEAGEDDEYEYEYEYEDDTDGESEEDDGDEEDTEEWEDEEDPVSDTDANRPTPPQRTIQIRSSEPPAIEPFDFADTQLSLSGVYNLPPITFLEDPLDAPPDEGREELEEVAQKIERTLASFKIEARVGAVQRGPVITQYEVSLAAGIKVHKIVSLSDDLAMALSARSVRVVAPIPGKSTVGIEVPNRRREMVCLKEILVSKTYRDSEARIPLLLGKDAAGDPIVEDLSRMPHLLIAGSTGSGKSVCINGIITSMLMTRGPDELKLILVDPKMVELSAFEEIPHLMTPVITDMKKAPAALEWLVRKMDQRYKLLSLAEVRHIHGYNTLGKEKIFARLSKRVSHEEAEQAPERLPFIVIIIDELADLMMTASKEVEGTIIRLSQKSRAVGIHVILATQRPSVDVITGLIKSNMPCRASFKVTSRIDSRTILDHNGAEKLLGQGDMLYLPPGTSSVVRAQSTFISDKEIRRISRFLKKEQPPEFSTEIAGYLEGTTQEPGDPSAQDDLFDDAVRVILESQRGSASLLQRRLGVGYTRASRLMDLMADSGIVGPYKGSKAREVFVTLEEWEAQRQE